MFEHVLKVYELGAWLTMTSLRIKRLTDYDKLKKELK